ncbi:ketopantoate reductase family protein [Brevibacillus sp. GCM10020057]|uniref:ketopantoate reductase family protein n=1 Tax=Brevibacillus sp. GCM10020057 TaxID=3317327 RepID=UPI0036252B3C
MTYTDFPAVLPILANNRSFNIIIGNNTDAHEMQNYLKEHSKSPKNVAFGFQTSAGSRKDGRIICIRGGGRQMVLGGLDGPIPFESKLHQAFAKTKYKLIYHENIDAWLKNHIVPIVALNYVTVIHESQMKKIAKDDKLLQQMITAMDEGFSVLEALNYPLTPAKQDALIRKWPMLMRLFMKIYHWLPISRQVNGSVDEIIALGRVFRHWKETRVLTPNWDKLENKFKDKVADKYT